MSDSLWEEKEDWIRDQIKHVMTKENRLVGDEPFALPIYALLTQMHQKKRRSFDGTFYYINLSKRILRVPHSYRADRCSIVENYHNVPNMYRMIETAVLDLDNATMAPLRQEMIVLRDKVEAMKNKFSDKDKYPHSDLDNQLEPITARICKKYNLEDSRFRAPSDTNLRWSPPDKDKSQIAPDLEFSFHCDITTFRDKVEKDTSFAPVIEWDFKTERDDNEGQHTPLDVIAMNCPTNEEFAILKEQFQKMSIETYEQYKTVYKEYNRKVQEFETTLADVRNEYKRVYDTYCATAVKEILLVQDFDAII